LEILDPTGDRILGLLYILPGTVGPTRSLSSHEPQLASLRINYSNNRIGPEVQ
jgi:hypothetical protein